MTESVICHGWHRRSPRATPRAKYRVWHRDDRAKGLKPHLYCGTHARGYRNSRNRWGSDSVWIIEEIK